MPTMGSVDAETLERRIRSFLREVLRVDQEPSLAASDPLISSGLVDSAGMVRWAAEMERLAGIRIPDDDVSLDNFDSIQSAIRYVMERV